MQRISVLVSIVVAAFSLGSVTAQENADAYRIVGYYTGYSIYEDYFVTDIQASQLTHLNYAYIDISANGQCVSADKWTDMEYPYPGDEDSERLRGNFKQLQLLKANNPQLQILMTVGGWEHSARFSEVAATQESRIRLVRSCVAFMRQYGFDGIDIDWRFPVVGGIQSGRPEDSENFTLLLAEFRGQLEYWNGQDGKRYLLTIAAPAVPPLFQSLQLTQLQVSVDWINLMAYGFEGEWSELSSPHAPLYGSSHDPRGETVQQEYNVSGAVNAYLDAGIAAEQIVLGVGFYGQTWGNLVPNDYFGLYQFTADIPQGTRPGGILYYRDLQPLLENPNYIRFFDDETKTTWMYNPDSRVGISYEDEQSLLNKAAYVRSLGLGGMMIWELTYDNEQHTLLNAVYQGLNDS